MKKFYITFCFKNVFKCEAKNLLDAARKLAKMIAEKFCSCGGYSILGSTEIGFGSGDFYVCICDNETNIIKFTVLFDDRSTYEFNKISEYSNEFKKLKFED